MIALDLVGQLVNGAADTVAAVASRWDVVLAAAVGGFAKEAISHRRERRLADERASAIAKEAARGAVALHVAECSSTDRWRLAHGRSQ